MSRGNVSGHVTALDQNDFREKLSPALDVLCEALGRIEIAKSIGCEPETVSNARKGSTTLNATCVFNLLRLDPTALNEIAAHFGMTLVPLDGEADPEDKLFDELQEAALEVIATGVRGRLASAGARLCHRTKAGMLKASGRVASIAAKIGRAR